MSCFGDGNVAFSCLVSVKQEESFAYVGSAKIASKPAAVFSRVGKMLAETALAGFLSEPGKVSAVKLFAEGEQQISFFPFGKKITDGTGDDVKDSFFLI